MSSPVVSVIIPVWNGADRIGMALDALAVQTAAPDLFEVIVVDNGSTDETAAIAGSYAFVTVLHEPEPGSYRARNLGLAQARGVFVLFTDGDCVPNPDWVEQAIAVTSRDPEAGIWAGRITLFREKDSGLFSARYQELISFNQAENGRMGHCVTANWLARRDMMIALGAFDANLLSGGDVEFSRRLTAAGHRISYVPEMTVGHPTRANLRELVRKRRRVVGGRWTINKWSEKRIVRVARLLTSEANGQVRWILRSDTKGWIKPGLVGIVTVLLLASYYELLRLAVGKQAFRS